MITLDWDDINYETAARRVCQILAIPQVSSLELRGSPSCDGFHIYIEFSTEPAGLAAFLFRRQWYDDGRRILGDVLSPKANYRDVMFVYKSSPLGNLGEMKMVKYIRIGISDKWKLWDLSTKHQLPTLLLDLPWLQESSKGSSSTENLENLKS